MLLERELFSPSFPESGRRGASGSMISPTVSEGPIQTPAVRFGESRFGSDNSRIWIGPRLD